MVIKRYGITFPECTGNKLVDDLNIELYCFRIGHLKSRGGLGKFEHFRAVVDLLWNNPSLKCNKRFVWNRWAEKMLREMCRNRYLGVAGCSSAGKSDPAALWALVNYIADPTHCLVLVMSTTLQGANLRIWKTFKEYWAAIPDIPGKAVWSMNRIRGIDYDQVSLSDSSGVLLLASEKSKEKEALGKLIGVKAPADQGPRGREGKLIVIIDEMTDCAESILHAAYTNLDSNTHFQMIGLGNPNSHFDPFGIFCTPKAGWASVSETDEEWETEHGKCIRFDAEVNPRITDGDEKLVWMPSQERIDRMIQTYGRKSLFFYRMIKGFWAPQGVIDGVYNEADINASRAQEKATWATTAPTRVAALDPSFTSGGDRCILQFGSYGTDVRGKIVLQFDETVPLHEDISNKEEPRDFQIARQFREECEKRGVRPEHAAYDATGAGGPFGSIISVTWSNQVLPVKFGGAPSTKPVATYDKTPAKDRYYNRCTEIWFAGQSLLRNGQLRGIGNEMAQEMCGRTHEMAGQKIRIEAKSDYKDRHQGRSPDVADAAFILVDLCKHRFGFKSSEAAAKVAPPTPGQAPVPLSGFKKIQHRARLNVPRLL